MSVLPDVLSEALDYNNIKRRAMASRSYRVRIAPSNKTSFGQGETIFLDLPSNLSGTFMDMTQTYIRFKATYNGGAGQVNKVALDKCGAYGFMQRVACITSGQQIFDLNNYNVLVAGLMDTDASNDWKANAGNVLVGTSAACPHGESFQIADGGSVTRTYCLPFILNPFALQKKLVPLFSLDSLRFRITLETAVNAIILQAGSALGATPYTLSDVELVSYFTELSPSAMAQLDSMTGGVYNLLCPSYANTQSTIAANATVVNTVLGIAVSSLERIIVIQRANAALVAGGASLGGRITNGIQTAQFFINSEAFPQRNVSCDDMGAEVLAEYLIADHALSDFSRASGIQNFNVSGAASVGRYANVYDASIYQSQNVSLAAGAAFGAVNNAWNCNGTALATGLADDYGKTTVGSFILAIELETGCSAGRSDRLYSGISTISSVVQFKGTFASTTALDSVVDFFSQFTILLTLNMRQTGVWSITI
jgi:hypothetical protein